MQVLDRNASPSADPDEPENAGERPIPPHTPKPPPGRRPGGGLVVAGVAVTMVGLVGDLVSETIDPSSNGSLVALGHGANAWHVVLFAGVLLSAVGGILWAARLGTDWGALVSSATILLLVTTVAVGAWAAWAGANRPPQVVAGAGVDLGPAAGGAVVHDHGAAATDDAAVEGAEGASVFGGHSHGEPGTITPQEARRIGWMLDQARRNTAKYRSMAAAKADGYVQVTQFVPGLGLHLARISSALTGAFDFAHPNVLLYQPTAGGGLELVGVAYSVPHQGPDPPEGFPGGEDVWHYHTNLCFLSDGSVTIAPGRDACRARGGYFQAQTPWLLHAWIWKTNPNGVFTESNPDVF